jgi:hypothetical protein
MEVAGDGLGATRRRIPVSDTVSMEAELDHVVLVRLK